jgi:mannose-6-phosphate isomerase-like protein (cupin superfamily)
MNQIMLAKMKNVSAIAVLTITLAVAVLGQSTETAAQRTPSSPARPFVVMTAQSVADLERKLQPDNKAEDLIGGAGMQTRVAVQHDKNRPTATAELHDASDDVYYVLEGTATLTLGGKLDAPKEVEPGEWRSASINGGQTFQITKGDLIVVPRGTPHQRTSKDFSMILIKIFAAPLPAPATPPAQPAQPATPPPAIPPKERMPAKP